jgi:hypothetical protein
MWFAENRASGECGSSLSTYYQVKLTDIASVTVRRLVGLHAFQKPAHYSPFLFARPETSTLNISSHPSVLVGCPHPASASHRLSLSGTT